MFDWLEDILSTMFVSPTHYSYLVSRGVDENTGIIFNTYDPDKVKISIPCQRFVSSFGSKGERLKDHLIIPLHCPRNKLIGFEARTWDSEGNKRVLKYMLDRSKWLPTLINAHKVVEGLWNGDDVYIVEGIFDLVALQKAIKPPHVVCSTMRAGMDDNTFKLFERFYTPMSSIYICYDNDETGKAKSSELVRKLAKSNIRSVECKYRGKDPNDLWTREGVEGLNKYFM